MIPNCCDWYSSQSMRRHGRRREAREACPRMDIRPATTIALKACGGAGGVHNRTPPAAKRTKKAPALQSAIQFASVRKWPFTSPHAPVGAPARVWPLLTGLCDSHRPLGGASLGPPQRPHCGFIQNPLKNRTRKCNKCLLNGITDRRNGPSLTE